MKSTLRTGRQLARLWPLLAVCGLLVVVAAGHSPGAKPAVPSIAADKYIGAKKCENCHDSEASGNQWGAWHGMGHSKAFEVLSSDEAKKVASELGIADASKADECLKCHVTAFGVDPKQLKKSFDIKEGVGCESCHGPGDDHARARFRAANEADEEEEGFGDEESQPTYTEIPADEVGMEITRELCVECHNPESPTYKPFCFYKRVQEVRHLNPLKSRTDEQRAAMLVCGCGESCACDHECEEGCGVPPEK